MQLACGLKALELDFLALLLLLGLQGFLLGLLELFLVLVGQLLLLEDLRQLEYLRLCLPEVFLRNVPFYERGELVDGLIVGLQVEIDVIKEQDVESLRERIDAHNDTVGLGVPVAFHADIVRLVADRDGGFEEEVLVLDHAAVLDGLQLQHVIAQDVRIHGGGFPVPDEAVNRFVHFFELLDLADDLLA